MDFKNIKCYSLDSNLFFSSTISIKEMVYSAIPVIIFSLIIKIYFLFLLVFILKLIKVSVRIDTQLQKIYKKTTIIGVVISNSIYSHEKIKFYFFEEGENDDPVKYILKFKTNDELLKMIYWSYRKKDVILLVNCIESMNFKVEGI